MTPPELTPMISDLWGTQPQFARPRLPIGAGAVVLRGFALPATPDLLRGVDVVQSVAAFRHMLTPGGYRMSVALTNCGTLGWTSDRHAYRYSPHDPETGRPWAPMPDAFRRLAEQAAAEAGYPGFAPDACLVNRYACGARLSLHQDRDELDLDAPIVSVSLGIPATFLFGGHSRAQPTARIALFHGDVVVWGGEDRLRYHGVAPLKEAQHPALGALRINLTFRKAGAA